MAISQGGRHSPRQAGEGWGLTCTHDSKDPSLDDLRPFRLPAMLPLLAADLRLDPVALSACGALARLGVCCGCRPGRLNFSARSRCT